MLGKTDEDLIIEATSAGCRVDSTRVDHEKVGAHGNSEIFIKRGYFNDVPFAWEVHRAPLINANAKAIGTVCVARDVTYTYTQKGETA